VAFKTLPRPQFAALQSRLFPIYFSLQTGLPLLLALTYPSASPQIANSLTGVLDPANRDAVLIPLVTVFGTAVANLLFVGPRTTRVMQQRKHQEVKDGKKSYDAGPHSVEMQKLNKRFGKLHGVSSLLNLASFLATVAYGVSIAARL
jgi:hypothetical protein